MSTLFERMSLTRVGATEAALSTDSTLSVGIWALRAMKGNSDGAGNSDVAGT